MKTTEFSPKAKAQDWLHLAEDYAAKAIGGVLPELQEDPARPERLYRDYAHLVVGLEVHFLFPNLSAPHQRLLAQLMEARNAVLMRQQRLSKPSQRPTAAAKTAANRRLLAWERRFQQFRSRAEPLQRLPELTAVQREVLRGLLKAKT